MMDASSSSSDDDDKRRKKEKKKRKREKKKRKKREAREAFHVEEDAQLEPYDGVVYEYNTLVLQYGYLLRPILV